MQVAMDTLHHMLGQKPLYTGQPPTSLSTTHKQKEESQHLILFSYQGFGEDISMGIVNHILQVFPIYSLPMSGLL